MKNKTCCFTGHRIIPQNSYAQIKKRHTKELETLVSQGVIYFGSGGAIGFDTLAANVVLELREKHKQVKLILILPCKNQSEKWNSRQKAEYEQIKTKADKIVYTSEEYTDGCMLKRNRHLVENSSVCVAYLTKTFGGTAYTYNYAIKNNLKTINVGKE